MKNTNLLLTGAGLLAIQSAFGGQPTEKKQETNDHPNIVWLSCEDISPRIGCYGDEVAQTPNIDKLATEGIKYTNVFTSAPVCAPCRSGIITGMHQTSIGTHHMRTGHHGKEGLCTPYQAVPPHYVKTFTEYLRNEGYYCTNNSKTDYQFGVPFTAWDECSKTAHYKNRPDKDQPFFAIFNYTMTHESKNWPDPKKTDPSTVKVPPYYPDTETIRKDIARTYDNIAMLDSVIGVMLKELIDLGLADNTIVFYWSDHGDGLQRGKRWLYDSGTRVPLIIRWPGQIDPGQVSDRLISSIDFGPTVLSLANVPVPAHMQGIPFLGNQEKAPRNYYHGARDRFDDSYDMIRSVRDGKYLYIRNYYPQLPYIVWVPYRNRMPGMQDMLRLHAEGKLTGPQKIWFQDSRPPEEFYDCQADPHNINNLIDDPKHAGKIRELSEELDRWRIAAKDMGDMSEDQMLEMFWPGGKQPVTNPPYFVVNAPGDICKSAERVGGVYTAPTRLKLTCNTHGASIGYTFDKGKNAHWKLYTEPIQLPEGETFVRAKSIRYGYKESEEITGIFKIK